MFLHIVFLSLFPLALFAEAPTDTFDDLLKTLNKNPPAEEILPVPPPIPELKPRELPLVREGSVKSQNAPVTSEQASVPTQEWIVPPPAEGTLQPNGQANTTAPSEIVYGPEPVPPASTSPQSLLVPQSDEFSEIYLAMLFVTNQRGQAFYAPAIGHSAAAATLVVCAPELAPAERVKAMHTVLNHLERVRVRSIAAAVQQGGRTWHPQLTQIAATLVCKMQNRPGAIGAPEAAQNIVQELVEAYKELIGRFNARRQDIRLEESLSNLQAAATLMN